MKIKDGYVLREIAGQYMAIPVGKRVNDLHGMIALNETGAYLWEQLKHPKTLKELTTALTEEYDVSEADAEEGAAEFIELLRSNNLLEIRE